MGSFFNYKLVFEYLPQLLSRLHITLLIVILATIVGLIFGTVLACFRLYKIPVFNQLTVVYVSFIRGTPIIVQMFIVYYGVPLLLSFVGIDINRWDKMYFVILTYGLNAAAFMSEIIRASVSGISIGQTEAAYAVGMTRLQTLFRIIVPQATVIAIPSLGTGFIGLLHDTSIAFSLGVIDVIGKVQAIGAVTYHTIEGYVGAALIFLVLTVILEKTFSILEKRLKVQ